VHQNRLVEAFEDAAQRTVAYADRIGAIEDVLRRGLLDGYDASRDVLLFAAHLHVTGARFSGSERELHVSETYATRVEHLPVVSYAAFGHIHRPQSLPGSVPGRFAGSPIQLDFGELDEAKQVVLVEVEPGEPARVAPLELKAGRRLRKFTGDYGQLERWSKDVGDELCLVTVDVPEPVPDLSDRLADLLPRATVLQVQERVANRRLAPVEELDNPGVEPSIDEHFRGYLETQGTKGAAADRVLAVFRVLVQAIEHEEQPSFADEALLLEEVPDRLPDPPGEAVPPPRTGAARKAPAPEPASTATPEPVTLPLFESQVGAGPTVPAKPRRRR
jgi:exonuclease SbcD